MQITFECLSWNDLNAIIVYNLKVSMQISSLLSYFFFLSWLCLQVAQGNTSSPPIWVSSSFFKAAAVSFIFTTTSTTQTVSTIYSSAIINTNLKVPTLGLTDLNYRIENGQILIKLTVVSYAKTGLSFQVEVSKNINFKSLRITYMALDGSFTPAFSMNYFFPKVNQNRTGINAQFFVNFTQSTGVILDPTHENVLLPFMHNIDVKTNDNTINIDLDFVVVNSSFYKVTISSTSNIYINFAGFSRLIFDKTAIEALGNDYFNYGIAEAVNNNQLSTTIPPDILPENLYYGLHSFTISTGLSNIIFTSTYNTTSGFIGFTPVLPYVYSKMKFSYMHHKTRTCPAAYPYYNISQLLCYDYCNDRWYGDPVTMTCKPCLYDCLSCTNATACATCSNTNDFRVLTSLRCLPVAGYFDDGTNTTVANPCTSPCATCQNTGTYCLSCITGYYLNSNNCLSCNLAIPNCTECTNSSYCTLCNTGTSGYTCTSCTSTQYQISNVCYECSSAITHCQSCTSSTNCALCQSTFTLKSATDCSCTSTQYLSTTCQQCSTAIQYCKTCSSSTVCTSCLDTFDLQSPTLCACNSSSYLDPSTVSCLSCATITAYCSTCNTTDCNSCSAGFTLNNGSCVCASGYYADAGTNSCKTCSSALSNCDTCSSSTHCTTCAAGYEVNPSTFVCDLQPCQIANCFNCNPSDYSICLNCDAGYSLSASSTACLSVCGDYQLSPTQQCDDGNKITGDGCSSTCKVQAGFSCQDQEVNATLTFSYCYYTGTITFHTVWIRKLEGVNTIKIDFQLDQNIQQWKTVNFDSILAIDTIDSATNFSTGLGSTVISSSSASYSYDRNRFSVTIEYQEQDMQGAFLSFILTPYANNAYPAFTPPANVEFFPPFINCIVEIKANNNQNCNLYSAEVYSAYGLSVTVTYAVVGVALLTIATSLIFRTGKVITFQMITLLQLTYFSLSFLESINPAFSGLLPLRFLAGILNFKDVEDYLEQTTSPNAMKGIYMFLNLSDNFAFIAISLACMLGLGGVSYLVYMIMDWILNSSDINTAPLESRRGYVFYRFAFHLIGQISLSLIIVCLPLFSISIIFQSFYTVGSSSVWSYGMGIVIAIAVSIYYIALIKSSHPKNQWSRLGEYLSQFSLHSFKTFKFTNFIIIMVLTISTLIIATLYSNYQLFASISIIFLALVDIVLVATLKPYRYGFVSCFKGEDNDTEVIFQKIELYKVYDKQQPQVVRVDPQDITQKSEQNENNSEVFAQHFATRKNIIRSRHQGLIQGGEVLNHSKLILFNNNFRRITNLSTLILVEFVFSCVSIFADDINRSYDEINIKVALPFLIHSVLFLNVIYNYFFLILQILDRRRENMAKVDNEPIDTSSQFMKSLYNQKQKTKQPQNSEITNLPLKTNNEIIKVNQNAKSLYDLKRPQIIQPIRNNQNVRRSKNSKIEVVAEED